jgi:hypothetical protein
MPQRHTDETAQICIDIKEFRDDKMNARVLDVKFLLQTPGTSRIFNEKRVRVDWV